MTNTEKLRTWTVQLTTLSPLFIGSGKTLSPYSDFIQEGNTLIYLDQKKIEAVISDKPELIDAYVKEIRRNMENTRANVSLKDFITTRLKLSLESVTKQKRRLVGTIGRQQLRQFISTAGRPFIPGSSLKGAFRTAVLYDWLTNDNVGKKILAEFIHFIEKCDSNDKKEREDAKEKIQDINIELKCFGNISEDPFRFLHIADSNCIESTALQACQVERVSIENDKSKYIPQPAECLGEKTNASFRITVQKPNQNTKFPFLDKMEISELLKKANAFYKEAIWRELDELDGNKRFSSLFSFYEKLEKQIDGLNPNEAILRLGGGKTFFENSVGLAIDDYDSGDHLETFLLAIKMPKYKKGFFPKTRTVVMENNNPFRPLGWIKLTII